MKTLSKNKVITINTKGRTEMISVSFVNNTIQPIKVNDSLIDIYSTIQESNDVISSLVKECIAISEDVMFNEAVGLPPMSEEKQAEKRAGVFEKIGEFALSVFKKIQEFIDRVIRTIKDLIYRLSPVEKKIDMIKKENPELANKVLAEIDAGNITMMDLKNLNEVDKMYKEILEAAKRKEVDAKTLSGKIEAFKAKFDEFFSEDSKAVKKLNTAATIVTAVTAIVFVKTNLDKAIKADYDAKKVSADWFDRARDTVKEMEKTGYYKALNPNELTKAQMVSNINNYAQGNFGKIVTKNGNVMKALNVVMTKLLQVTQHDTDAKEFIRTIHKLNNMKP